MPRVTRADVYQKFRTLCLVMRKKCIEEILAEKRSHHHGAWHLEYERGSGYYIEEMGVNKIEYPMGTQRRGAAEMVRSMDFAIGVLQSYEAEQKRKGHECFIGRTSV